MDIGLVHGHDGRSKLPAPLDLEDFAIHLSRALGISPPTGVIQALGRLFRQSSASAHEIVLGYRHFVRSARMAASSINRHLAALRLVSKNWDACEA